VRLWSYNPNKWVFNRRLNCPRLSDCLSSVGKEFHTRGPATAKRRSRTRVGGLCTSDGAGHRVRWTESTRLSSRGPPTGNGLWRIECPQYA